MSNIDLTDDYDPEVKEAVKRFSKLKKENERLQVELGQAQMRASEFEGANKQLKLNIEALKRSRDFYMARLVEFQSHFENVTNVVRAADSCLMRVSEYQQQKAELPPATFAEALPAPVEDDAVDDILEDGPSNGSGNPPVSVNVAAIVQKFGLDNQKHEEPKKKR